MFRSRIVVLAVFGLLIASPAAGQATANVAVSFDVSRPLSLSQGRAISFGDVGAVGLSGSISMDPITATGVGGPTAGRLDITGVASTPVTVTFPASIALARAGQPSPVVTYSPSAAVSFSPIQSMATATSNPGTLVLSGTGVGYVFFGGSGAWTEFLPSGAYTGTLTVSVDY